MPHIIMPNTSAKSPFGFVALTGILCAAFIGSMFGGQSCAASEGLFAADQLVYRLRGAWLGIWIGTPLGWLAGWTGSYWVTERTAGRMIVAFLTGWLAAWVGVALIEAAGTASV